MARDTGEEYKHKYKKIGSYAGVIREFDVVNTTGGPSSGIKKIVNVYAHTSRTYAPTNKGISVKKGLIAGTDESEADEEKSWRKYTRWYEPAPRPKGQKVRTKKRGRGGKPRRPLFSIPITRLI